MSEALLEARGLVKTFGRVRALRGANFAVFPGEVVALIGDNGAGKSVLVKCLSGVHQPDAGEILMRGEQVKIPSPLAAMHMGIETVYQDLALADDLEASANLYLGRELYKPGPLRLLGVLDRSKMRAGARQAFQDLGIELQDVRAPIESLSGGQRQSVAVARSVVWASTVILLDEPTAALGVVQRQHVLEVIRRVRDHANVPFLCDFQRAVGLSPTYPYKEIADFLAQQIDLTDDVLNTLRYVDCALLARRITADCLFSVGLMDEVCPPSTVFAAYHEVPGNKEIAVYPFGVHDLPRGHAERQLRHLRERLQP